VPIVTAMTSRHIVVIEDETPIAAAVAARLRSEGFEVSVATTGPDGVGICESVRPDLVVLDLMLPGLDGLEVCRRIQQQRATPVIMLTARDTEADLLTGLAVGADDYLTKPFSPRELVARVHAVLRRVDRPASTEGPMRLGPVELDPITRRVTSAGDAVHLTPLEFDLLHQLGREPGRVHTREQLLSEVWGYRDTGTGGRTVDSHVQALRRKLGDDVVRTVHGVGYAVDVPAS